MSNKMLFEKLFQLPVNNINLHWEEVNKRKKNYEGQSLILQAVSYRLRTQHCDCDTFFGQNKIKLQCRELLWVGIFRLVRWNIRQQEMGTAICRALKKWWRVLKMRGENEQDVSTAFEFLGWGIKNVLQFNCSIAWDIKCYGFEVCWMLWCWWSLSTRHNTHVDGRSTCNWCAARAAGASCRRSLIL